MSLRRRFLLPLLAPALLLAAGCGGSSAKGEADRAGIEAAIEAYLPLLATAYAEGDLAGLAGHAATKEIASVDKRIQDLKLQGRVLEPKLRSVTVEELNVWSHSNAYVTTVEVWDLQVYSTGARQLLSEELGQQNRVKYQLKRDGDGWLVLYRTIVQP